MLENDGQTRAVGRPRRILVVEENRDLLEALQEMLEAMEFEVAAYSGEILAIAAVATRSAEFDLLIGDAVPSVGDGVGLVDRFRARCGPMPALLLAGAGMSEGLRRRVAAGEIATLSAPFSARQLAEAVAGAMATRVEVAEAIGRRPGTSTEVSERRSIGGWSGRLRWALPLAAGLALAVGLTLRQPAGDAPSLPRGVADQSMRGSAMEVLGPRERLAGTPGRFEWREYPAADSYTLQVQRVDDSLVWRETTTGTVAEVTPKVAANLQPAVAYHWSVEAFDSSGNLLAHSARIEFSIRPMSENESGSEERQP